MLVTRQTAASDVDAYSSFPSPEPLPSSVMTSDGEWVRLSPEDVRIVGGCAFKGCPRGHPFLYLLTSHRNRGASLNRWVRSVARDLESPVNTHPKVRRHRCVNVTSNVVVSVSLLASPPRSSLPLCPGVRVRRHR
jgi:hypothetical protein